MPQRPHYAVYPGDMIHVVIVQPDDGRALVVGKLDRVPVITGGRARKIEVHAAEIRVLRAAS
jgi:hypothetical protein